MTRTIRIGTRGSMLALAQARWVQSWLRTHYADALVELVIIRTTGDRFVEQPLSTLGGKGVFVKEIEEALLADTIDLAVHSLKDVPVDVAPGLVLAAIPQREDPRDVVVGAGASGIASLPERGRVGTSSLRRAALVRARRPDLEVLSLRGNVDSRLRKLDGGELDAIVLAAAGLRRLGLQRNDVFYLDPEDFIPAIGQGALAIETRQDHTTELLADLNDNVSAIAVAAERAFLRRVGGSCRTPLAAHAVVGPDTVTLRALIASPDGTRIIRGIQTSTREAAEELGRSLGSDLLARGGKAILDALTEGHDGR